MADRTAQPQLCVQGAVRNMAQEGTQPQRLDLLMKQILLATALIALPVAAFSAYQLLVAAPSAVTIAAADPLGDLSALTAIVFDVQAIVAAGDMSKAEARITDFETGWDDAATAMRALDSNAWGNVDQSADAALDALRAGTPDPANVSATLVDLMAKLGDPAQAGAPAATGGVVLVSGIAVTDEAGRALPCETLLAQVADGLATSTTADKQGVIDFQTKALERCNADDDTRADGFSAQALALLAAQ